MRWAVFLEHGIVLAAAIAFAGCSLQSNVATNTRPTKVDRSGEVIAFNVSQEPHSLDPLSARSDDERQLAHLTFDMLLDVDAGGHPIPALAVNVPTLANGGVSPDGLMIVYHLRRGVRWQDGARFTSRDVHFTWQAIVDPRNQIQSTRGYDLIASIDTPDALTAVVHLKRRWAPAVATFFTYGTASMPIVPAHLLARGGPVAWSRFSEQPIGTGPYRLVRWERSQRLVYEANDAYFRGPPHVKRLVAQIVPDTNTDLVMLRGGQLDWSLLSPAQRLSLTSAESLRFVYTPFGGFGALALNCRHGVFFADPQARRAIALAIDRDKLSRGVTNGQYPVTDSDQPTFSWARNSAVHLPAANASAADDALDRLGWRRGADGIRRKDGKPLELVFAVFPESDTAMRTALYVQEMLRQRGVGVTIKRVSLAQFYLPAAEGGILMSGNYDLAYFAWRSGEDPDDSDLVTCRGSANYAGYCNLRVDALEAQALSAVDIGQRRTSYSRVQRELATDLPYLFLYAPRYSYAVRAGVSGISPSPYSPTWNSYAWRKRVP